MRPVNYKGEVMPFALAKMNQWKNNIRLWALEQVFTKDESDQKIKAFPDKDYFWLLHDLWLQKRLLVLPKTRRMMVTHFVLSLKFAHVLLFEPNTYNGLISIMEDTATTHLRDRTLFTLQHLDYRFPYPTLSYSRKEGIHVTKDKLINYENGSSINAYASGSNKFRGHTMSKVLFDEFAFQPNQKENWEATLPALEGQNTYGMFVSSVEPGTFMQEVCEELASDAPYNVVRDGLSWQENKYKATIVYLNYRADPDKNPDTPKGKEWFDRESAKYNSYQWLKEYEGRWRFPVSTRVYYKFNKQEHCRDFEVFGKYEGKGPIYIGFDPGTNYPCITISFHNSFGHYVSYQCFLFQNKLMDYVVKFVQEYLYKEFGSSAMGKDIWYIDPAGKAKSGHGTALSAEKMLKKELKHNRVYYKYTEIKERVDQYNYMFEKNMVKVNPNCGIFYPEMGQPKVGVYVDMLEWGYQNKKVHDKKVYQDTEPDKDSFFDHMSDANGYVLAVIHYADIKKHKAALRPNKNNREIDPWFYSNVTLQKTKAAVRHQFARKNKPFL